MTSAQDFFDQCIQFLRDVIEAFKRLTRVIVDAFALVFGKAKACVQETIASLEASIEAPKHIPPRLDAPRTSWAYYSKRSFHQPKHAYKQERKWRAVYHLACSRA